MMDRRKNLEPEMITCGMCGHRFDPAGHIACAACPLQRGCQLVCCPACGFETVDPRRSMLGRLFKRWISPSQPDVGDGSIQRSLPR